MIDSEGGDSRLRSPLTQESSELDMSRQAVTVRAAHADDLPLIKALLDGHRHELGFVPLPALRQPLDRGWLYVAYSGESLVGMINWWARRDDVVVLYNIVVAPPARGRGAGGQLLNTLIGWARARNAVSIRLKCPLDLPANDFYRHHRFALVGRELGKRRPLNCWSLPLRTVGSV